MKEQLTLDEMAFLVNLLNEVTCKAQLFEDVILPLKSKLTRMGEELGQQEIAVVSNNGAGEEAPKRRRKRATKET